MAIEQLLAVADIKERRQTQILAKSETTIDLAAKFFNRNEKSMVRPSTDSNLAGGEVGRMG